jgi:hypothetical protein
VPAPTGPLQKKAENNPANIPRKTDRIMGFPPSLTQDRRSESLFTKEIFQNSRQMSKSILDDTSSSLAIGKIQPKEFPSANPGILFADET